MADKTKTCFEQGPIAVIETISVGETFEKCLILFKFKKDEDVNHPDKKTRDRQAYIEYSEDRSYPPKGRGFPERNVFHLIKLPSARPKDRLAKNKPVKFESDVPP